MIGNLLLAPALAIALFASACGAGSTTSASTSANHSSEGAVFKRNAELYGQNLKSYASTLSSCVTGSITSGQAGKEINACVNTFAASVAKTTKELKAATDRYLQGLSGPCRTSIRRFADDADAVGEAFSKVGEKGGGSAAVSAALSALGDPQTQRKLADSQSAFNDALKTCSELATAR